LLRTTATSATVKTALRSNRVARHQPASMPPKASIVFVVTAAPAASQHNATRESVRFDRNYLTSVVEPLTRSG